MLENEKMDVSPLLETNQNDLRQLEKSYKSFMFICETIEKTISRYHNFQDKDKVQLM